MTRRELLDYLTIRFSGLFDYAYYLKEYRDVRLADIDPLWHFVKLGWKEERNPSKDFDTRYYLEKYSDVRAAGINPLAHFIRHGKKEGRTPSIRAGQDPLSSINKPKANSIKLISKENFRKVYLYGKRYGFLTLVKKIKTTLSYKSHIGKFNDGTDIKIHERLVKIPVSMIESEINPFQSTVSIIIPTKNAGEDFELNLKMLINQKGFSSIEIVVVDSGSTDNTIHLAQKYNARVITIRPDEFSHSYARNLGAENATGDYLLFTVQDALPPTNTWLYDMMTVLKNNDVCAVSCAEFPREDADLFYRVISWNHYKFLGVNESDRIFKLPAVSDYISLRQNGQLSDIACLIPSELFMQYKYRFNYAEDLDLGIRLIKDGQKIAFLGLTRIIHSHNRPASYFLKRGYVDNLFLSNMFNDFPVPRVNFTELVYDILFTYEYLNKVIVKEILSSQTPQKTNIIEAVIREGFKSARRTKVSQTDYFALHEFVDEAFTEFLKSLSPFINNPRTDQSYDGFLVESLMNYTNLMLAYLNQTYEIIDAQLIEEINLCMNKELAILIGAHLAHCYKKDPNNIDLGKIHAAMIKGI